MVDLKEFGPRSLRTLALPLESTLGILVTQEDFSCGIRAGGHWRAGEWLQTPRLDALVRGARPSSLGWEIARKAKLERFRHGKSYPEIAAALGVSAIWVKKVCLGARYWWCGWDLEDIERYRKLEGILCSMPSYRSGSS